MSETKPVEGASIAEALLKLNSLEFYLCGTQTHLTRPIRSALERTAAEGEATRALVESLGALHGELKGAQLMIFDADTPEKRSEAFKCVGAVVAFLMKAERELRLPAPPKGSAPQDCECDCGHELSEHGGHIGSCSECDACSCSRFLPGAARAAPPADEVAGLLEAVKLVRFALDESRLEYQFSPQAVHFEALERIENHLKGKR